MMVTFCSLSSECLDPFDEPECEALDLFVNELLCVGKGTHYWLYPFTRELLHIDVSTLAMPKPAKRVLLHGILLLKNWLSLQSRPLKLVLSSDQGNIRKR